MKSSSCCFCKRKQCFKKTFHFTTHFFGLYLVWLIVKMMVNHQWDGWTWQVIAYSPTVGWWPADSQIVCSDTKEMSVKDFISFKYQTVFLSHLRPVLSAFERQPIKKKSRGCYLVDRLCPSGCPPAPLLWTPLAPRQGTFPFHPALCGHACFSAPDAFLHIMQKTAFWTVAKQMLHGQQQNVSLIFVFFLS